MDDDGGEQKPLNVGADIRPDVLQVNAMLLNVKATKLQEGLFPNFVACPDRIMLKVRTLKHLKGF